MKTTYEIYMLKINSEDNWELWDTCDVKPTEDYLEEEMELTYCLKHFEDVKVIKVERTNIFQSNRRLDDEGI